MSSCGASKDYRFGRKNNWRRTVWNEVLRRTAGAEKAYPVLYLAGPHDLDRVIAVSKGVPPQNLIAIDRHDANVSAIRGLKQPAICADAVRVLYSWPKALRISAVLLDFCHGFEESVLRSVQASQLSGSVIAINLQRGRDSRTNQFRHNMVADEFLIDRLSEHGFDPLVHRGMQAFAAAMCAASWNIVGSMGAHEAIKSVTTDQAIYEKCLSIMDMAPGELKDAVAAVSVEDVLITEADPKFFSYRSGNLVFDSVVYRNSVVVPEHLIGTQYSRNVARKISATLAIRTQRINGVRVGCRA